MTALLLIAVIATVSTTSLSYYIMSRPNQTQNNPSPTPMPTSTPTPTPTPTPPPTPSPSEQPTGPSSVPKPSVPDFTVTFEAHPYYVPPTYSVDRYTGETVMTKSGYHVKNESIVIRITPISFEAYTTEGKSVSLSYAIRVKGHFEEGWTSLDTIESIDSEYIVRYYEYGGDAGRGILRYVPPGGILDFQVEARIGYYTDDMVNCRRDFTGESSGWSSTKTLSF